MAAIVSDNGHKRLNKTWGCRQHQVHRRRSLLTGSGPDRSSECSSSSSLLFCMLITFGGWAQLSKSALSAPLSRVAGLEPAACKLPESHWCCRRLQNTVAAKACNALPGPDLIPQGHHRRGDDPPLGRGKSNPEPKNLQPSQLHRSRLAATQHSTSAQLPAQQRLYIGRPTESLPCQVPPAVCHTLRHTSLRESPLPSSPPPQWGGSRHHCGNPARPCRRATPFFHGNPSRAAVQCSARTHARTHAPRTHLTGPLAAPPSPPVSAILVARWPAAGRHCHCH